MVPPFVIVGVNVTLLPEQIELELAEIDMVGVTNAVTVIVIEFDVAGLLNTPAKLEVITQVTTSPVFSVLVVKVALFVPTLVPFTFH